jgi:prepilin-type processing-associated H-X9-DG protein
MAIISVMVAILLPAVSAARRQAVAVRCATQLREIGNAFQMYSIDNRGYYPPLALLPEPPFRYGLDGVDFPHGSYTGAYWFNFLAKYVTKSRLGYAAQSSRDLAGARSTVFWGCGAWEPYRNASSANVPFEGISPIHTGYGMTYWPDASPTNPAATQFPRAERSSYIHGWAPDTINYPAGRWWKQKTYGINGSAKALVGDSRFWALNADAAPADGIMPRQSIDDTYNGPHQTFTDLYRHGKYPPVEDGQFFSSRGGKVAFNILYCDGHVALVTDWREAYRAIRQRFPG